MNEIKFDKEIEIAIKAAQTAGRYLKEEKKNLNLKINSNPRDTKLIADVKSEKLILDILNKESKYPVLAEETGKSSEDLGEIFWVVDPLDGTANYNRNIPICCVSIGLVRNMKPVIGVIFDFNNSDIFVGDNTNKKATLNNIDINVSDIENRNDGVLITGLPFNTDYSDDALKKLITDMQTWKKVRMIGSAAMASCYVASGKADLYQENGIYLWDIIAGAAIVESAGGKAEINNINETFQVDVIFSNSKI
jgi:myo-inositol-1(or 4)-monophosphatase|tara:strand:- start:2143 stop:2892 length:750 start_codon:yes stop_codon:yes gene_type:complete